MAHFPKGAEGTIEAGNRRNDVFAAFLVRVLYFQDIYYFYCTFSFAYLFFLEEVLVAMYFGFIFWVSELSQ